MTYTVKEMFYSLQGEGAHSGRPAVFCRFAGCNLWSGREQDRDSAVCKFCDTEFIGWDGQNGGKFKDAEELAEAIVRLWPDKNQGQAFVVCTGGEPALQLDRALIDALHVEGFEIAIETNGSIELVPGIDWVCVSPKADAKLVVTKGDELKLIYPQAENRPEDFCALDFSEFYLQPLDDSEREANTAAAVDYCLNHPQWKLSLQTHKILGID
jgi:7-carboxy-7-deazaguanine synthase (Cx14CxxC type)